jgi:hypothetical protein
MCGTLRHTVPVYYTTWVRGERGMTERGEGNEEDAEKNLECNY